MAAALSPGDVFHEKYEVLRPLAQGGMGAVYEVVHVETKRRAALKVMLPSVVGSEDLRSRFRAEARVASGIQSEHIVEILDAGVDRATGNPFLVMELLRGQELLAAIEKGGPIDVERTLFILGQLSRTLDRTHAARVVHRDLKPDNVFLTNREDGTIHVKILDFGIAKILAEGEQKTRKLGTPLYAAPEQFNASSPISPQTDLYALAHITFTMLVGTPFWMEELSATDNVMTFLSSVATGQAEAASSRARHYGGALPAGFDAWFRRATSPRGADRFASAGEQHAALEPILRAAPASPVSARADLGTMDFLALQEGSGEGGAPSSRGVTSGPVGAGSSMGASSIVAPEWGPPASGSSRAPSVAAGSSSLGVASAVSVSADTLGAPGARGTQPPHAQGSPVAAAPRADALGRPHTLASEGAAKQTVAPAQVAAPPPRRRVPVAVIAVGGAAVVALAIGGVVLLGGSEPATTADPVSAAAPGAPPPRPSTSVAGGSSATLPQPKPSASAKAPDALDEITFTKVPPKVGDSMVTKKAIRSSANLTRPFKDAQQHNASQTFTETVLAADGKAVLKMKIAYGPIELEVIEQGKTTNPKSAVANKTYVVEYKNGAVVVTDENYKPVSAEETAMVKEDEKDVGKPLVQLTSLPDGPIKKGARVETIAEIIRSQTVDAKTDVTDLVVTLKSVERDRSGTKVGVFAIGVTVSTREQGYTTTAKLAGTMSIREDSRPVAYKLEGPMTMKGPTVEGDGKWSMSTESE